MKMTRKNVRNFMFLFWICFLLTAALMLFLRGFFLTKIAFKEKNFCKFPNTYNTIKLQCSGDNNEPKCWQRFLNGSFCLPKSRHRAVILLIDALRLVLQGHSIAVDFFRNLYQHSAKIYVWTQKLLKIKKHS